MMIAAAQKTSAMPAITMADNVSPTNVLCPSRRIAYLPPDSAARAHAADGAQPVGISVQESASIAGR
jgi:hypothetical protein